MKKLVATLLSLFILVFSYSQKRSLDHADVSKWKTIQNTRISDDGRWVSYQATPREGDPGLYLYDGQTGKTQFFERSSGARLSADNSYLVFIIKPAADSLKAMRRRKAKKEDLPKDTLAILSLASGNLEKIPNVKSFQLPEKWAGWVAYHMEPSKAEKDDKSRKKESADNGSTLVFHQLSNGQKVEVPFVKQYIHAEEGQRFGVQSSGDDSLFQAGVYLFDVASAKLQSIFRSKVDFKYLSFDKTGVQLAFLADLDTTKARIRPFELFYWRDGLDTVKNIANNQSDFLPKSPYC